MGIYFLRETWRGYVKIGYSRKPKERVRDLQSVLPQPCEWIGAISGSSRDEHKLHERFNHLRVTHEWFRVDAELADYLTTVLSPHAFDEHERAARERAARAIDDAQTAPALVTPPPPPPRPSPSRPSRHAAEQARIRTLTQTAAWNRAVERAIAIQRRARTHGRDDRAGGARLRPSLSRPPDRE